GSTSWTVVSVLRRSRALSSPLSSTASASRAGGSASCSATAPSACPTCSTGSTWAGITRSPAAWRWPRPSPSTSPTNPPRRRR
ncbi:hypothetical protein ASZ78_012876, partial [Callipepla squamata]